MAEEISLARRLHPELVFEVIDRREGMVVQLLDAKTMKVVDESPWVRNAAKRMNCSRGTIERDLRLNQQKVRNGYAVRYKPKEETPWEIDDTDSVNKPVCIQVTNRENGEVKIFNSLREIEKELKVSRTIVNNRLRDNKPYEKYLFKIYETSPLT